MLHIWGRRDMHTGFWWGKMIQRICLEDLLVDGRIIIKILLKKGGWQGVGWIYLALDRGNLRNLMKEVTNFRRPMNAK
jgi:hypothetical protein